MPEIGDRPTGDYHADPDDQHTAVVTSPVVVGGTRFEIGDRITPKIAREHRIPHVVTTDRPSPDTK